MNNEEQKQETQKLCPFAKELCMGKECALWVTTQTPTQMGVTKTIETCVFIAQFMKPTVLMMGQPPQGMNIPNLGQVIKR